MHATKQLKSKYFLHCLVTLYNNLYLLFQFARFPSAHYALYFQYDIVGKLLSLDTDKFNISVVEHIESMTQDPQKCSHLLDLLVNFIAVEKLPKKYSDRLHREKLASMERDELDRILQTEINECGEVRRHEKIFLFCLQGITDFNIIILIEFEGYTTITCTNNTNEKEAELY